MGINFYPYYSRSVGAPSQVYAIDDGNSSAHLVFFTAPTGNTSAGSERMRITNSGYVGIGTTNPSSTLQVAGTNMNNCVGIGTTNPQSTLDVNGSIRIGGYKMVFGSFTNNSVQNSFTGTYSIPGITTLNYISLTAECRNGSFIYSPFNMGISGNTLTYGLVQSSITGTGFQPWSSLATSDAMRIDYIGFGT